MDGEPTLSAVPDSFAELIGLELTELTDELARGRMPVRTALMHAGGSVHGGAFATVAQSLAARASAAALSAQGKRAVGLSNLTHFLAPVRGGHVHALARRRHSGRTTWVWEVEMTDDQGRLCALSRVTIAVAT